ncbi:phospholipase, patatin family [Bacteriovorax sp. BSW11_IV]|uniref:patatin-like phospholipase family protein n=1 Tax=Bacteriovorax sp. BSW11_IV TaxID=1353529 RepID=UPI00038A0A59|nr:patatin-like phospholipase family protein [Bacteriovorax sp. BSW11_IV]EQC45892.1 phospholipase, patatin family [Bacteriovorax sp. BSW11_IV]
MISFIDRMLKRNIGLALGGGGARGAAHIGVLRVLEENRIDIRNIAGTSAGAIVAALYAFGMKPNELEKTLKTLRPIDIRSIKIGALGVFENGPLIKLIETYLPKNALIEQAEIPLAIHTTDIETGEAIVLSQGRLKEALLASCCVPGIYTPQIIDGRVLVDGGLTENVPISALHKLESGFIMAVNLNGSFSYMKPDSIIDVATNALDIAIDQRTRDQIEDADLAINLDLFKYSRTSAIHFEELVKAGYEQTKVILAKDYL